MVDPATRQPARGTAGTAPARLDLDDRADAARAGRRFVKVEARARGAEALLDDAELVAAELLANARQHAEPPIAVTVFGDAERLRLEVSDGSSRVPVRPAKSTTNMTGRGLALVEALTSSWGVERTERGKTVWAELPAREAGAESVDEDVHALLAAWDDDLVPEPEPRYTVVLGDVPTELLIEAKAHVDNLVREFSLAAASDVSEVQIPDHLARLIDTVVHSFADARDAIKRQAMAAAGRGEPRTRLTLRLAASAADAGEAYLEALDEADGYARAARLLTLETPADHRLFRRWYVTAVVRQLRTLATGAVPEPIVSFEERLLEEVRRLSAEQRVSERAARLQRVTAALAGSRTPEDVATVVLSEGVEALNASGGGLLVPAGDGEHLAVPGVVGYGEELVGMLREERRDALLPAATALRTARPVWLETQEERDREFPELRGMEAETIAMCAVPLVVGGRCIGALRFSFSVRRLFDEDERRFVLALAALTAQTLERTELYEAERQASNDLQRALLPDRIPAVPGWEVATYYSPAGEEEAGGDFYDVIPVPDGRVVAVIGDVMGRGIQAAAAMAQIRSMIRAYAIDDPDPVTLFTRVDRFFDALDLAQLVTVLYCLVEPDSGRVRIASAGHLPPLLVDGDGSRLVATATGTPFGAGRFPRSTVTIEISRGASLLAITDGLVERRGEDIDEGVARLTEAVERHGSTDAAELLRHVVAVAASSRTHDDDVTALVLRRQ